VGGPFSPYWDIDTSTVIYDTCEGYRYSFDIVVNTSNPPHSSIAQWNKTALGSSQLPSGIHTYTRRYVQLNCKIESDITYKPYYLDLPDEKITPCIGHNIDASTMDRLHHDQGIGACQGGIDVGYLVPNTPGENMSCIHCTQSVCGWFDENVLLEDFTLTNIYAHVWWSSNLEYAPNLDSFFFGFSASRGIFLANHTLDTQKFRLYNFHNVSHITYHYPNYPWTYDHYSLSAGLLDINDYQFTTNNIYEFAFDVGAGSISVINNRSITSFIILNVPDNNTLNTTDWTSQGGHLGDRDGDGLSDWTELYVIYTNPFISDTDNDGISDNEEYQVHSDPNNYLDQNLCPEIPQNPTPPDFAHNVNVYSSLSWDPCGDPDGETVTYTVYLKARDPQFTSNDIVSENQTALSFNPGNDIPLPGFHMEGVTKYFWKIVAYDEHGAKSEGPVWCFKTAYAYEQYNRNILQE